MQVESIHAGKAKEVTWHGQELFTALEKEQSPEALYLTFTNLEGDEQGNTVAHGGVDKAACVYAAEHYDYWEKEINRKLPSAAFGENFTVSGLTENIARIGDIFRWGEAVVQISQPRQPCFKLAARYGIKQLPLLVRENGYSGFYLRVLEEGNVAPGSRITLITPGEKNISISEANRIMYLDTGNTGAIENMLEEDALADAWREPLTKRLVKLQE